MKVIGIDIGNGVAVCCPLYGVPSEPRQFNIDAANYYHFKANAQGVRELLELKPDIAVMEPTGTNYSRLWGTHLARNGVEVRLVGHNQLSVHRSVIGYSDKDDEFDAFALAHYCFTYFDDKRRFVQIRDITIATVRELVLRLAHLNRVQSPIINRLRQDLAWQFPEASKIVCHRHSDNAPLLWRWLAGCAKSQKYDRAYSNSIGLGLTDTARNHAARLCDLQAEEVIIERRLAIVLSNEKFARYRRIFNEFGMGMRMQAILISQIYPVENFLDEDGKPIEILKLGRKSKKLTKRYLSQRRFEKALGLAPNENSSGQMQKRQIVGGSDICRSAFWQWVFTRVETANGRKNNRLCQKIHAWMKAPERMGTPIKLLRMKTASHAARLLFKKLVFDP
jgi:transposase